MSWILQEKVEDVEESNSVHNLLRGTGNLLAWIVSLSSSQPSELGPVVGEGCRDED